MKRPSPGVPAHPRHPRASAWPHRAFAALLVLLLQACASLPSLDGRSVSTALQDTADTRLGRSIAPLAEAHPGESGLVALVDGRDAFAARVRLADLAERTLDVQYYLWHADLSGTLLFEALRRAADRGVRVRLLLDDNNTSADLDAVLAALDAHPNIEVRLFNPFPLRRWRALGYLTDFARLNRRMHNKSFTADNQVTVVGGRNVGDEYFAAGRDVLFVDLDVAAVGPVVREVSRDFDRYWAAQSSYPAGAVLPAVGPEAIAAVNADVAQLGRTPAASAYAEAVAAQPFVRDMLAGRLTLEWAVTRMVSDDPAKGLGQADDSELLWSRLERLVKPPVRELELVSPYFVPGEHGTDRFAALAARGVKVAVLTNALEATDVPAVHAGYAKRRHALLEAGVELFEMKRTAATPERRSRTARFGGSGGGSGGSGGGSGGSTGSGGSASSLHAKTFSVDRSQLFIGSFNFDPRSARLNTELGFVIDSPAMAAAVADSFATRVPATAYRLSLDGDGGLRWTEQLPGATVVHAEEPGMSLWQRIGVSVLSVLPIDWLL